MPWKAAPTPAQRSRAAANRAAQRKEQSAEAFAVAQHKRREDGVQKFVAENKRTSYRKCLGEIKKAVSGGKLEVQIVLGSFFGDGRGVESKEELYKWQALAYVIQKKLEKNGYTVFERSYLSEGVPGETSDQTHVSLKVNW